MKELKKQEMLNINGGGLSAAMINAFIRGVTSITDLGRYLGSSIRRITSRNLCN